MRHYRPSYAGVANSPYPPQMLQRTTVAVQTLQLNGDGAIPRLLVWVTPLRGGGPLANVTVELWRGNASANIQPSIAARNTTTKDGLATFMAPSAGVVTVAVLHEGLWVVAAEVAIQPRTPTITPHAALYVAHPLVRPGSSVAVWGFVWQPTGGAGMRVPSLEGAQVLVAVASGFQSGAQMQPGPYAGSAVGPGQAMSRRVNVTVDVDPITGRGLANLVPDSSVVCTLHMVAAMFTLDYYYAADDEKRIKMAALASLLKCTWFATQGCSTQPWRSPLTPSLGQTPCSCCWSTPAHQPALEPP